MGMEQTVYRGCPRHSRSVGSKDWKRQYLESTDEHFIRKINYYFISRIYPHQTITNQL